MNLKTMKEKRLRGKEEHNILNSNTEIRNIHPVRYKLNLFFNICSVVEAVLRVMFCRAVLSDGAGKF